MSTALTTAPVELPRRGSYRLVPSRSTARFTVGELFGLVRVSGTFSIRTGEISIGDEQAQVTAHLDAASVCTGNKRRDKDLRGARFLDVQRYPELTFEGSLRTGESTVSGRLVAHGQSVSCPLLIREIRQDGNRVEVVATTRLDRYAYWITAGRGLISRHVDVVHCGLIGKQCDIASLLWEGMSRCFPTRSVTGRSWPIRERRRGA